MSRPIRQRQIALDDGHSFVLKCRQRRYATLKRRKYHPMFQVHISIIGGDSFASYRGVPSAK
jgi:hypothetical protein